jgi:serine/threonine protein kinase
VAVKEIIMPAEVRDAERETARDQAVVEAQMAARLSHPNVVRIYDILTEDGRPWIVMELVPYRSLRDVVADDGPLTPAEAAQVGLGILAALRAAHAEGVLHRDVKPANVLVGPGGRVVLTDFGIARAADAQATTSGRIAGSPPYISPERARGERAGTPGDMWGLGATLYAAVEGRPPFERNTVLASLTAVVADDPEPSPGAGPLWPVISELLRKDPAERLDAAGADRMLREVILNPTTAEDPPTRPEPAREEAPGQRRRRWAIPAAVAAAMALGGVAAAVALLLPGAPSRHTASASASTSASASASVSASSPRARASSPRATTRSSSSPSPASSPSGAYGALPAGYTRFTNSTGFSIGVPQGWQVSHSGHYVYIDDPANSQIYLLIDQSDQPKSNPLADWEQQQANRESTYPDYHLIRLASVDYPQAEKAADWEFTYDRNGVPVHVLNRNVLANAQHAYALYWSTPESDWTADYRYFAAFASTFRPAS